jgi:hypothetical protein
LQSWWVRGCHDVVVGAVWWIWVRVELWAHVGPATTFVLTDRRHLAMRMPDCICWSRPGMPRQKQKDDRRLFPLLSRSRNGSGLTRLEMPPFLIWMHEQSFIPHSATPCHPPPQPSRRSAATRLEPRASSETTRQACMFHRVHFQTKACAGPAPPCALAWLAACLPVSLRQGRVAAESIFSRDRRYHRSKENRESAGG